MELEWIRRAEKSLRICESGSPEELTLLRGLERLYGGIERFREFVVENGKHMSSSRSIFWPTLARAMMKLTYQTARSRGDLKL